MFEPITPLFECETDEDVEEVTQFLKELFTMSEDDYEAKWFMEDSA